MIRPTQSDQERSDTAQLAARLNDASRFQSLSPVRRIVSDPVRVLRGELHRSIWNPNEHLTTTTLFTGQRFQFYAGRTVGPLKYGFWDAHITSALLALIRPEDVAIDVGAHLGYYTAILAHLVGPSGSVHAFEPTPRTAGLLRNNTARMPNVRVYQIALSDQIGAVRLLDFGPRYSGLNTIARKARIESADLPTPEPVQVPSTSLDVILPDVRPRFVKIDAESAEAAILRGMKHVLATARPMLLVEVGDYGIGDSTTSDTMAWLADRGYRPFEWTGTKLVRHEVRDSYLPGDLFYIYEDQSTIPC